MASIRERKKQDGSSVFAVQVRQRGFPAITATFPTIRMAQRWAKTKEAEMIEGRHFAAPRRAGAPSPKLSIDTRAKSCPRSVRRTCTARRCRGGSARSATSNSRRSPPCQCDVRHLTSAI